jgi:uncharacterized membrane protein YhaH (DUF805 family)
MPAVLSLLLLIIVLSLFGLFLKRATPYQIGRVLAVLAIAFGVGILVLLALSGRLPWALFILIVLWPIMAVVLRRRRAARPKFIEHTPSKDNPVDSENDPS